MNPDNATRSHTFKVWAPEKERLLLHIVHPSERILEMRRDEEGVFSVDVDGEGPGTRYFYRPEIGTGNASDYPDPASNFQPEGVHGPSEVVDHAGYAWSHPNWRVIPLEETVLYELHVGTFTTEGTFESAISRLTDLKELGVTTLELMPVSQFVGDRNWGYDGVYPYAVQNSYGGPEGLKKFVDACHGLGLNVVLDVVYNHWGPEGNYVARFGPYFTEEYRTPWGPAVNLDGPWSDGVREFLCGNILHWFENYHFDALRVDAVHTLFDKGAIHFWQFVQEKIRHRERALGRPLRLIAESDLNSPRVLHPPGMNGFGFDAQWLDDFHHALYTVLDKNGKTHYVDFGSVTQLAKAYNEGFVHSGEYVRFRKRKYGASSVGIPGNRFVAFIQNHDQVGNRAGAERLSLLVDFERLKVAAAAVLLSPYVPMLFMGEEYGEEAPFYYFADYENPDLIQSVSEGRMKEFAEFNWGGDDPPDPFEVGTFEASRLQWKKRESGKYRLLLQWHKGLLGLRKILPALHNFDKGGISTRPIAAEGREAQGLLLRRHSADRAQEVIAVFNFGDSELPFSLPDHGGDWTRLLNSRDPMWCEEDSPESANIPDLKGPCGEKVHPHRDLIAAPASVRVYVRDNVQDDSEGGDEGEHHVA